MSDWDYKDLSRRTASDKVLRDKAFHIAKKPQIWWISKRSCFYGLVSMVYKFFAKNSASGSGVANNETEQNLQLAKELQKPIIRNFKK